MVVKFLLVALGGALGSCSRFGISMLIDNYKLPIATFLINFVGSLLLGLGMGAWVKSHEMYFVGVVGFCGGFTTFSTFSYEVFRFLRDGQLWTAFGYAILSVFVCVIATYLGFRITNNTI